MPEDGARQRERLLGQHAVREALRAGRRRLYRLVLDAALRGRDDVAGIEALAAAAGLPVLGLPRPRFVEMAGPESRSQGVLLEAGPLPEVSLADLEKGPPGRRRILALDGVEDPQNLGAVARIAEASGVAGLLLTRRRAPPLSPAVARASAGAIEHLPVARVTNLPKALESLHGRGFWTVGIEVDGPLDLFTASDRILSGDLVVVLGAEGRGLRRGVRAVLDHLLRIPMAGKVASLNVATAAAVVLFELRRRCPEAPGGAGASP